MQWTRSNTDKDDVAKSSPTGAAEQATVAAIRAGDAHAFDAMVVAHYEPLLRLAFSYLESRESAEEVVQDVFLSIWQHRARWAPTGALRVYLFTAVRNGAFSQLRHRKVERRVEDAAGAGQDVLPFTPASENADERQRAGELQTAIQSVIQKLPPRTREAFVLSRQQHLTHQEVARVMGTSDKTVQEQIGRALKALRIALADWLE